MEMSSLIMYLKLLLLELSEMPIKYEVFELKHSHHYGEVKKLSETAYFEGISIRNKFSNA